MLMNKSRQLEESMTRKRRFLDNVAARLIAIAVWKVALLGLVLMLGGGAVAAAVGALHDRPEQASPRPEVVLDKLVALGDYHAAQGQYSFDFTDVLHSRVLFFTGESIQVRGRGSVDAIVSFSDLASGGVVQVGKSVTLLLPIPHLGTPVIDLSQTELNEHGGLFTHISHLIESGPGDADKALEAAEGKISIAAARDHLARQAETDTREFLAKFLGRLGFTKVTVIFG